MVDPVHQLVGEKGVLAGGQGGVPRADAGQGVGHGLADTAVGQGISGSCPFRRRGEVSNCLAVAADDGAVTELELGARAAAMDLHPLDLHPWPAGQGLHRQGHGAMASTGGGNVRKDRCHFAGHRRDQPVHLREQRTQQGISGLPADAVHSRRTGLDLAHGRRHRLSLRLVGPSEPDQREVPGHISVSANQVLGPSEECGLKHQIIGGVAALPELTGRRHNVRPGLNHQQVKAGLGIGERPGALQAGPGKDPGEFIQQGR